MIAILWSSNGRGVALEIPHHLQSVSTAGCSCGRLLREISAAERLLRRAIRRSGPIGVVVIWTVTTLGWLGGTWYFLAAIVRAFGMRNAAFQSPLSFTEKPLRELGRGACPGKMIRSHDFRQMRLVLHCRCIDQIELSNNRGNRSHFRFLLHNPKARPPCRLPKLCSPPVSRQKRLR